MNRNAILLVFTTILCAAISVNAQTQRLGFVNSAKIFQEIPEAQDAQKRLDAIVKPIQDTLEAKQKELQARYDEYQKKEGLMTEAAKKSAQQEILELEQKYNMYRQEQLGNDGQLAKQQERILNPIKDKILKAIERVAKEEKYGFVFDQTDQVRVLLYGDPANDLTFKVIDKLKRGK
ncbi:MAG: OmpH family outer membrane protein [Ignavibacteriae bacterium]|nr:OmpH family outer membrane protein [Ignavibacteriota bacterium]